MCTGRAQERDLGMRVRKPIGKDYKSIDTDQQFLGAKQNLHSMSQDPLIVLYSLVFEMDDNCSDYGWKQPWIGTWT